MEKKVIFDLGAHKGEDSDFYLRKGFRVVAVDASDELCEKNLQRFKENSDSNEFKMLNYAVTDKDNEIVTFYQNTNNTIWGTIFDSWDARNKRMGSTSTKKNVNTIRLDTLLKSELQSDETVEYIKIDIEGADVIALKSLLNCKQKPRFVSIESEKVFWDKLVEEFSVFQQLGFTKFKIIDQTRVSKQKCPNPSREGKYIDYKFEVGSSGLFGDDLPGEWLSAEDAMAAYKKIFWRYKYFGDDGTYNFRKYFKNKSVKKLLGKIQRIIFPHVGWYDTHATF